MSVPIKIGFIGSSTIGCRALHQCPDFALQMAGCLRERLTPSLEGYLKQEGIPLHTFQGISGLREFLEMQDSSLPFLIYQLDILVPSDLTETYRLFNLHRGDLMTNRGPNPDVWPILRGDSDTAISLHQINENVDSGIFLDEYRVSIELEDDVPTIRSKLEKGLPALLNSLSKHLHGDLLGRALCGGVYLPWVRNKDITINIESDSIDEIQRKIRSQKTYNGAIVFNDKGEKKYVTRLLEVIAPEHISEDKAEIPGLPHIIIKAKTRTLLFELNQEPKYPPLRDRQQTKRI